MEAGAGWSYWSVHTSARYIYTHLPPFTVGKLSYMCLHVKCTCLHLQLKVSIHSLETLYYELLYIYVLYNSVMIIKAHTHILILDQDCQPNIIALDKNIHK